MAIHLSHKFRAFLALDYADGIPSVINAPEKRATACAKLRCVAEDRNPTVLELSFLNIKNGEIWRWLRQDVSQPVQVD